MARRLSSPVFVGRSSELQTLLATADFAASGPSAVVLVGGEAGVGKSRLVDEAAARLRERRLAGPRGWRGRARRGRAAVRPDRRGAAVLARQVEPERIAEAAGTEPARARPARPRARRPCADAGPIPASQAEWLQIRIFEGILRLLGRLGEHDPGPARHRGPALGRPVDPRPAGLPGPQRAGRAPAHRRDLPQRRAAPPPSADGLAGRGRTPAAGRADRPGAVRARRAGRAADRQIAGASAGAALVDSIARRSDGNAFFAEELVAAADELAAAAASGCPRRCAASCWSGWPARLGGCRPAGRDRRRRRPRRSSTTSWPRSAGCPRADLGPALREARRRAAAVRRPGRRRRALPIPPCARAGGRLRRAPAVRAARAPRAPMPGRSRRGRPAPGRGAANRLVEIAHHWAAAQDSTRALHGRDRRRRRVPSGLRLRRGGPRSTSARSSCGTSCPPTDRPTDRDLADLFDSAARRRPWSATPRARSTSPARDRARSMPRPTPSADRERRARARERLGFASWLAGDTATSIQLLEEAVDLLEGTPPSTERRASSRGWPRT